MTDRDTIIAVAGGGKRELSGKRISPELEQIMESRRIYQFAGEGQALPVSDSTDKLAATVAAPILAEGDLLDWCFLSAPSPRQPPATRNTSWPRPSRPSSAAIWRAEPRRRPPGASPCPYVLLHDSAHNTASPVSGRAAKPKCAARCAALNSGKLR